MLLTGRTSERVHLRISYAKETFGNPRVQAHAHTSQLTRATGNVETGFSLKWYS